MPRWIPVMLLALAALLLGACGGGGGGDPIPDEDPTGRFDSARFDEHRWGE